LDVHELVRRSQWRAGWLVPSNAIVLCRAHHMWCHDHPLEARNLGLLRLAHEAGEWPTTLMIGLLLLRVGVLLRW
jgi:hypothetical protein